MKLLVVTIFYLVGLLSISSALAQEGMTHQQIEQKEGQENVTELLDEARTLLNRIDRQWKTDCAKAVGYEPFCSCISKDIPSAWSFSDYVAITTKSKEENQYNKLDAQQRKAYDIVFSVRDKCVRAINKKP
jgi:hypothetical protein